MTEETSDVPETHRKKFLKGLPLDAGPQLAHAWVLAHLVRPVMEPKLKAFEMSWGEDAEALFEDKSVEDLQAAVASPCIHAIEFV